MSQAGALNTSGGGGSGNVQTLTGNTGGAVPPTANNINVIGSGSITVTGTPGTSTLTISSSAVTGVSSVTGTTNQILASPTTGNVVLSLIGPYTPATYTAHGVLIGEGTSSIVAVADTAASGIPLISQSAADPTFGTAVVAGGGTGAITLTNHGVLLGQGTSAIVATAVGATGTVLAGNTGADPTFQTIATVGGITTITGNSGGAESPLAGNFNILGTGSITVAGSANTETVQLTGLTNHNVQVGAGTATLTQVAPSTTAGIPLVSNGSTSDPSFTTALVAGGGTAATSFNTNGAVISNTTATGALAAVSLSNQQFLVGNTSAAPTAKGFSVVRQVFTSSGTYTPTSGMIYCDIEVVGGGGGGGGAAAGSATFPQAAGGGGGGGYARKVASSGTIGASQTVTIGAAGTAGTTAPTGGGTGGTTSVGAIVSATGGVGGTAANSAGTPFTGGTGGVGSSGDFNTTGQPGGFGVMYQNNAGADYSTGGYGGSSFFGGGALQATISSTGNTANSYGGGGNGGNSAAGAGAFAGGAGFAGLVVITEYILS